MPLVRNYDYDYVDAPRRYYATRRNFLNSTIHDPTDFEADDSLDLNANDVKKKKKWKDLFRRSSRKDKENRNHVVSSRSLSSVSFRSEKPERSRRRESGSLSRYRTSEESSSTATTDYEEMTPAPSYVIYPASSFVRRYATREMMMPVVAPVVYLGTSRRVQNVDKSRIYRSPTYHYHDAFVNSHEWTLSRTISEMRLGIVGIPTSGKTSLVHRYLTGSYSSEESPEGGRFKKEVILEGQSHLLLIRDEGSQQLNVQFCQWVDAVIFVFSVCCAQSFDSIRTLVHEMNKFRNINDLPLFLVGTKDNVSEKKGRIISEDEGRQLAAQMKRCHYYETSSTYGTNVERVFKDACCKIIQHRLLRANFGYTTGGAQTTRTPTPTNPENRKDYQDARYMSSAVFAAPAAIRQPGGYATTSASRRSGVIHHRDTASTSAIRSGSERSMSAMLNTPSYTTSYRNAGAVSPSSSQKSVHSITNGIHSRSSAALIDSDMTYSVDSVASGAQPQTSTSQVSASTSHLLSSTPSSTPNTQRKHRRISNIFARPRDVHEEKTKAIEALNLGVGRAIPVKQGLLYKKSTKSALNREWKKKYVCLYNDGRLTYHQNLKDYMDKTVHGKEVFLGLATVKVSGRQRPRNTQRVSAIPQGVDPSIPTPSSGSGTPTLKNYESRRSDVAANSGDGTSGGGSDDAIKDNNRTLEHFTPPTQPNTVAGNTKKKRDSHRRIGSSGKNNDEDDECFEIVTHNQQRWEFCAGSTEERDEWVAAIEEQIELALTAQTSQPTTRATGNKNQVQALRQIPGNEKCADCGQPNPDWASLNLGTLICIECSGIHRNLGSHISRVRSLELDGWPVEYLAVMQSIGNEAANRMWEYNIGDEKKPTGDSPREDKEKWIDRKYKQKCFLELLPRDESPCAQLVGAVLARDVAKTSLLLANGLTSEEVNATVSAKDRRTVLHLACSIGSLEIVQLLLWNNADIRALDENGRSCLWYAQNNGFAECVEVLVTAGLAPDYGCPKPATNGGGHHTTMISCGGNMAEGSILGSMANRDYSYIGDEVIARRAPPVPRRNLQTQPELEMMPASSII
ncbi:unnamed protein product [Caenorhabditis bovis]|uniref:Uncharacterized protein n=1 Tax=Caenorhabditis bovis TaxID=2654633 RepID=A0A8S1EPZ6_9PELO|nr:unnamed protein product [Caenorhabditis bovis]